MTATETATPTGTPLQCGFTFFYMSRGKASKSDATSSNTTNQDSTTGANLPSYSDTVKQIGTIHTVEEFWQLYNHLVRPSVLPTTTDYHFFREGIQPTWEDPSNCHGGKWIVRLKKGLASRYWEEIVLALIGGQFQSYGLPPDEVCGAVVSIRYSEDIVSVWNRNVGAGPQKMVMEAIKRILHLPNGVDMEYKPHQDSLMDRSSFRNTMVWRPKSLEARETTASTAAASATVEKEGRGRTTGRANEYHMDARGEQTQPDGLMRRSRSGGDGDEIRGSGLKSKGKTELERAWR